MAKKPVLTVNDMREQMAANTSIMQLVAKQQLDIVNAIMALKGQTEKIIALLEEPVGIQLVGGEQPGVDSGSPNPDRDQAVSDKAD